MKAHLIVLAAVLGLAALPSARAARALLQCKVSSTAVATRCALRRGSGSGASLGTFRRRRRRTAASAALLLHILPGSSHPHAHLGTHPRAHPHAYLCKRHPWAATLTPTLAPNLPLRSSGTPAEAVSKAVAQSFSDCRALPGDQSCDAVAQAQAKARLCVSRAGGHSWRRGLALPTLSLPSLCHAASVDRHRSGHSAGPECRERRGRPGLRRPGGVEGQSGGNQLGQGKQPCTALCSVWLSTAPHTAALLLHSTCLLLPAPRRRTPMLWRPPTATIRRLPAPATARWTKPLPRWVLGWAAGGEGRAGRVLTLASTGSAGHAVGPSHSPGCRAACSSACLSACLLLHHTAPARRPPPKPPPRWWPREGPQRRQPPI